MLFNIPSLAPFTLFSHLNRRKNCCKALKRDNGEEREAEPEEDRQIERNNKTEYTKLFNADIAIFLITTHFHSTCFVSVFNGRSSSQRKKNIKKARESVKFN